ncbi:MAG: hypothetical protein ACR2JB_09730 [Bryobacteraceae bacterium]
MPSRYARGTINSLPSVHLENENISLSILPGVGAKIHDLIWKASGYNILWHNPRIRPQHYPIEANFDNYWCGGWDEGFPTWDACEHQGESYPNLGELRSVSWDIESLHENGNEAVAELSAFGPISPVRAVKTVTLSGPSESADARPRSSHAQVPRWSLPILTERAHRKRPSRSRPMGVRPWF